MHLLRAAFDAVIPAAQAHEKWFVAAEPARYAVPAFYHTANPYTIGAVVVIVSMAVIGFFVDRWYERSSPYAAIEARIRPWRDYAAGVLSVTTGIALLYSAWQGQLLATNFPIPPGLAGDTLRLVEAVIGGLLFVGLFAPAAAVALFALYGAMFLLQPGIEPLDYVNFAGIAVFLLFFARGRHSLDWLLGKPVLTTPAQRKWAYLALRVFTGFALLWLGLLKWQRPDLHFSLLDRFPSWNPYVILQAFGIGMSRELYVFILFVVESTIGLFVTLGFLTRAMAVMLAPVFLASLAFLGPAELVGHLPILGTIFVLFVYGDTYHKNRQDDRYGIRKTPG